MFQYFIFYSRYSDLCTKPRPAVLTIVFKCRYLEIIKLVFS